MTPPSSTARRRATPARRLGPEWIPQQHGAWAMLVVPAVVGAIRGGLVPLHGLLFALLFAGYFLFNATALAVRSRRWSRYRRPLLAYGALTGSFGAAALLVRPSLLEWLPAYAAAALISVSFSWRRADRALANDAVTILAACVFAAVMNQVAASPGGLAEVWVVVVLFAYFFGTALYVKTVIRERANRSYHRASLGYHAAWTLFWAVSGALGAPVDGSSQVALTVFFAALTLRAVVMAGRRVRPLYVGLGEIAASTAALVIGVTW